jgi:hypothetical protein
MFEESLIFRMQAGNQPFFANTPAVNNNTAPRPTSSHKPFRVVVALCSFCDSSSADTPRPSFVRLNILLHLRGDLLPSWFDWLGKLKDQSRAETVGSFLRITSLRPQRQNQTTISSTDFKMKQVMKVDGKKREHRRQF